jgi:hypothetical protein
MLLIHPPPLSVARCVQHCWHVYRQVCLSLMERSEYAAMEKHGLRKLRRISAEVHTECKSVLDHLMENRQARKIRDKLI